MRIAIFLRKLLKKSGRPNTSEEAALGNEEAVTEGQRLPAPLGLRGKHLPTQRRRESYESGMTSCKPIQNAPPEAQQATAEEVNFSRNGITKMMESSNGSGPHRILQTETVLQRTNTIEQLDVISKNLKIAVDHITYIIHKQIKKGYTEQLIEKKGYPWLKSTVRQSMRLRKHWRSDEQGGWASIEGADDVSSISRAGWYKSPRTKGSNERETVQATSEKTKSS
ncbi:hypothetical protein J6590_060147 [Homalodisca vitripennis]|nr:hypothetical protein J6590_060147 [Homalodisca vitripennis]